MINTKKKVLLVNKAQCMLDCVSERIPISLRKVAIPLYLPPVRPTPVCCVQFKAPQYRTDMDLLEPVQQVHQDSQGLEHRAHTRRSGWSWDCSAWGRGSARGSYHCLNLPMRDYREDGGRHISEGQGDRTRGNIYKSQCR